MPLDRSRPLWEVYLIDGYGDGAAVLMRMHHCIADGIALARVMLDADRRRPGRRTPTVRALRRAPLGRSATLERRGRLARTRGDRRRAASAPRARHRGRGRADARASCCSRARTRSRAIKGEPARRPPRRAGRTRSTSGASSAPHERSTRRSTTCWSARSRRRSPATWRDGGTLPDEVHALVPFNLRPLDEPLPRELGNRFGLVLLGLPVGVDDPVERTLEVKRRMDAIKHGHEGAISYGILELMGRTPGRRRGAPDRLLLRQGIDGADQRPRPAAARCRSPARRSPACSSGRRARAASA